MNIQTEEMYRARFVAKDMELPCPLQECFFLHLQLFTNLEDLQTPYYWAFYSDYIFNPSLFSRILEAGLKIPSF